MKTPRKDRTEQALERAGGTRFSLRKKLPFRTGIGHLATYVEGGRETLISYAAMSSHPGVKRVADAWESLSKTDRTKVPIEDLCEGQNVSASDFIAEVVRVLYDTNMDASKLLAVMAQPKLVQRAVEFAATPSGHKHMETLFKATGFLPTPQGARINVNAQATAQAGVKVNGLPTFEAMMIESAHKNTSGDVPPGDNEQGD